METKNKLTATAASIGILSLASQNAAAENVAMNTAQMQALDKITGQMKIIDVPVNGEVSFGSFSVVVRSCQTTPPEETPENYAFVDVADTDRDGKTFNIFKGWMVSSSPSLNSVEHPIYDVWLLKCLNTQIAAQKLLSPQQLEARDRLEKQHEQNLSKEAQIAQEFQAEQALREEQRQAALEEEKRRQEEAREEKIRQQEIDKEIQSQQIPDTPAPQDNLEDGEGPVSLLNIGRHSSESNTGAAPAASSEQQESKENTETVDAIVEDTAAVDAPGSTVVIEDTHHETLHQDLDLPADISEIMPKTQQE